MDNAKPDADRLRLLAESLDCLTEADHCLLAGITPTTAETWRKRGKGPAYVLHGNAYLYPRKLYAEHLLSCVRARTGIAPKALL